MNQSAGGDMYITGGSIELSEYENNMTPNDQKEYEDTIMELFQQAYQNDVLLKKYQNVSFKHWLATIDGDDWRSKAEDYDETRVKGEGSDFMYPGDAGGVEMYEVPEQLNQKEQIYLLQRLAHLHTGLVEDLVTIVESNAQDIAPQGAPSMMPMREESMYEGGGDQGPF